MQHDPRRPQATCPAAIAATRRSGQVTTSSVRIPRMRSGPVGNWTNNHLQSGRYTKNIAPCVNVNVNVNVAASFVVIVRCVLNVLFISFFLGKSLVPKSIDS